VFFVFLENILCIKFLGDDFIIFGLKWGEIMNLNIFCQYKLILNFK